MYVRRLRHRHLSLGSIEKIHIEHLSAGDRLGVEEREADLVRWVVRRYTVVLNPCKDVQAGKVEHLSGIWIGESPTRNHTADPCLVAVDHQAVNVSVEAIPSCESVRVLARHTAVGALHRMQ